jgi:uncharacterized protein YgiM (DUF1202 family)
MSLMNKQRLLLPVLTVMLIALSGCGLAGFENESPPRERLDTADWPTVAAATATVSPTPFPMATLAPTTETTGETAAEPTSTPTAEPDMAIIGGTTSDLVAQASALSGGLEPVAVMKTNTDETTIRRGPGNNYGPVETVARGELGAVLGQDASGDWLYVLTITNLQGWVPAAEARVLGSLAEAPVLPPDPVAAALAQAEAAAQAVSETPADSGATAPAGMINPADLEPVATGRISTDLVNMRQRPGAGYKLLGTLPADTEVAIFGLNRDREWVLVATADLKAGWVSMDYLDVTGSLNAAPQYRTLEPIAANLPAPIVPLNAGGATTVTSSTGSPAIEALPVSTASSDTPETSETVQAAIPANVFGPVADGFMNAKTELRAGPDESFGALAEATKDLVVQVLAVNPSRDWAVVRTPLSDYGWLPLERVEINSGSTDNAQAVETALVTSNNLPIATGPGIYFDDAGLVNKNELVALLGVNSGRNWALIETVSGARGWIQLRLINTFTTPPDTLPEAEVTPQVLGEPIAPVPAPSGPPAGTLVFQLSSGGDIMRINADGSALEKVTTGIDPVLSPDGSQIAFTRWQGDVGTLWVANADGSGERAILGEMRKAKGPDWSPDGSQIVLNFQHGGRVESREKCVGLGSDIPFGFAEDIRVVYEDGRPVGICFLLRPDANWSLRVVDVNDGSYEDLYGGLYAFRPAWDPGQTWRIVSDAGNGLLAVDPDNNDYRQQLTTIIDDGSPVLSPDGRFIVVTTREQNGSNLYRLNADGTNRVQLTQTPLWEGIRPDAPDRQWNNVAPAWSPDGSRVAFLTDRNGRWEVWVMNADGSSAQPLFSDEINDQLDITYDFVDERVMSWR